MSTQTFLLPDVGEGLTEAEIVSWRVAPGDNVAVNDVLVEIETAKSLVELPSPFSGTVGDLLAAEGDTVNVGTAIITIAAPAEGTDAAAPAVIGQSEHGAPAEADGGAVLVGYGTGGQVQSRRKKPAVTAQQRVEASVGVIAKPPIRKLARDLGVHLADVTPSGAAGEVTREDVVRRASQASVFRNIETPEWPAVREETIPVAVTAPHPDHRSDPSTRRACERARGVDPRARGSQGGRLGHGAVGVLGASRLGLDRRRRDAHDGTRPPSQDLVGLRRHEDLTAPHHGAGGHLGRAPDPDGQRRVGRHR